MITFILKVRNKILLPKFQHHERGVTKPFPLIIIILSLLRVINQVQLLLEHPLFLSIILGW